MEPFITWTGNRGGNISFVSLDHPWKSADIAIFGAKISHVKVRNDEVIGNSVDVCGFKAWIIGDRTYVGPDPEEEAPKTIKDLLREAVDMLPVDERKGVMELKIGEILEDSQEPKFNLPKMTVLNDLPRAICPYCGTAGALRAQDGNLLCAACHHDWGDIDYLPNLI